MKPNNPEIEYNKGMYKNIQFGCRTHGANFLMAQSLKKVK